MRAWMTLIQDTAESTNDADQIRAIWKVNASFFEGLTFLVELDSKK